jgi:chromate transport protein ChrA
MIEAPVKEPGRKAQLVQYFLRLGLLGFGGPVALVVISLGVLFRWRVSNPLLIAAAAVVGLIAYPLLRPAWVMVQRSRF